MEAQKNPIKDHDQDFRFMRQAIDLAVEGLGRVAPNPSVGCLIVKDGKVLGAARSADGGRPHAETQALAQAGEGARGAVAYTTLEPCGHHGVTPPCVDALIKAGVARVVIACLDPNQRSNGCIERLEKAGIAVTQNVCAQEALLANEGFFKVVSENRPMVTAKIATSLDGRIALGNGQSKWITGEQARAKSHEYRAAHDAVMVGVGTVLADDPMLDVRLSEADHQPLRIVIDHDLKTPPDSRIVGSAADGNVWFLCSAQAAADKQARLRDLGVKIVDIESKERRFAPDVLLAQLAAQGITRLFIEGGGRTLTPFLQAQLVDHLLWFRAPKLIGGDGLPAFQALGIENMDDVPSFRLEESIKLGEDMLEIWQPKG